MKVNNNVNGFCFSCGAAVDHYAYRVYIHGSHACDIDPLCSHCHQNHVFNYPPQSSVYETLDEALEQVMKLSL